ncbi:MAG: hypothetical protein GSR85_10435 [Desulfurococcales archaeon]|nr:hypothetical protein [Desulfurococcales archaeon]
MRISEEPVEGEIELAERKVEEVEEEVVVTQYKISDPTLVEMLLDVVETLDAVAGGKLSTSEARAIISEKTLALAKPVEQEVKKARTSKKRSKKSKSRAKG